MQDRIVSKQFLVAITEGLVLQKSFFSSDPFYISSSFATGVSVISYVRFIYFRAATFPVVTILGSGFYFYRDLI